MIKFLFSTQEKYFIRLLTFFDPCFRLNNILIGGEDQSSQEVRANSNIFNDMMTGEVTVPVVKLHPLTNVISNWQEWNLFNIINKLIINKNITE